MLRKNWSWSILGLQPFKPSHQNSNSYLLSLRVFSGCSGENLLKYQLDSPCVIMSIILMTTLFYKALILQGEIWLYLLPNKAAPRTVNPPVSSPFQGKKLNPPSLLSLLFPTVYYSSLVSDRLEKSITTVKLIWGGLFTWWNFGSVFFSSAAWALTSCTWAFQLCIPLLYGEPIPPSSLN